MKFLVISDLHAHNDVLDKMDAQFNEADGVLFAGDFAECFKPETGAEALKLLCKKHDAIFAVLGNCDNEDFLEDLEAQDVCVEKSLAFFDGLAFAGSGGGTVFTGKTEFERSEDDILSDFDIVKNSIEQSGDDSLWQSLILISHNPPLAQKVDSFDGVNHAGSAKFAEFIKENKPLAVVCGHIHEGRGIESIGETVVINPGSLGENGFYAWLEVEKAGENWKVVNSELCEIE